MSRNKNKSLLWKLTGKNGNVGHLFGTIHIAHDELEEDFTVLKNLILESQTFYAETDLDEISNLDTKSEEVSDTHKIVNLFSEKKIKKLYNLLKQYQLYTLDMLKEMHAMSVYKFLLTTTLSQDDVIFPDYIFWTFAKKNNIDLLPIEDVEFQMDIGDNYSEKELKKMLNAIIDKPNKPIKELNKLMEIYMSEDIHKLQKYTKKSLGKMRKILLFDRNVTMSQKILEIVNGDDSFFITLGAGHLGGEKGILSILKKKSIKIEPIKWK